MKYTISLLLTVMLVGCQAVDITTDTTDDITANAATNTTTSSNPTLAEQGPKVLKPTEAIDAWVIDAPPQPNFTSLTETEQQNLIASVSQLSPISSYPYSGCHDRAHLLYQTVPTQLHDRVGKVWLLAPSLISLTQDGAIGLKNGPSDIAWNYHVALTFVNAKQQTVVIDPAVGSLTQPMLLSDWLGKMSVPQGSALVSISGEYFQFNTYGDRYTWKGSLWKLTDNACTHPRKGAARDVIGAQLLSKPNMKCGLTRYAKSPMDLLWLLEKSRVEPFSSPQCQALSKLYASEILRLTATLGACNAEQSAAGWQPKDDKWQHLFTHH